MKSLIYTVLLCLVANPLFGQNIKDTIINSKTITLKWPTYRLNGQSINGKALRKELNTIPESSILFRKAQTNKSLAYLFGAGTISFALLSQPSSNVLSGRYGKNNTGFKLATIFSAITMVYLYSRSYKKVNKAITIYNWKNRIIY